MWGKVLFAMFATAFIIGIVRTMLNAPPSRTKDGKNGWGWRRFGRFGNPADWY